jgi:uncharacterized protein (TIGR03067 family)
MRLAPPLTAFALAAALVGSSTVTGQPPVGKVAKTDADLAALQGDWVVTKIDVPHGDEPTTPEALKRVAIGIRDRVVTVRYTNPDGRSDAQSFRLELDPTRAPPGLDLTELDEKGQPVRIYAKRVGDSKVLDLGPRPPRRAIYKLEVGGLVVCLPSYPAEGGYTAPRPSEFKAVSVEINPQMGVSSVQYRVLHLARKK